MMSSLPALQHSSSQKLPQRSRWCLPAPLLLQAPAPLHRPAEQMLLPMYLRPLIPQKTLQPRQPRERQMPPCCAVSPSVVDTARA